MITSPRVVTREQATAIEQALFLPCFFDYLKQAGIITIKERNTHGN